jgi:hypothetical protein
MAEIAAALSDLAADGDVSRLPKTIVIKHRPVIAGARL